ncbi:MAG: hypothetical protein Q8Q65_00250 [bacterium]|nr:hypothetical protein [bacterium]
MQITAIIRGRGQLTIPEEIRKSLSWISESVAVTISTVSDSKVLIEPHRITSKVNWNLLRSSISRVREFTGKTGNLAKFIVQDREAH